MDWITKRMIRNRPGIGIAVAAMIMVGVVSFQFRQSSEGIAPPVAAPGSERARSVARPSIAGGEEAILIRHIRSSFLPPHIVPERIVVRKMPFHEWARFTSTGADLDKEVYVVVVSTRSPARDEDFWPARLVAPIDHAATRTAEPLGVADGQHEAAPTEARSPYADENGLTELYYVVNASTGAVIEGGGVWSPQRAG